VVDNNGIIVASYSREQKIYFFSENGNLLKTIDVSPFYPLCLAIGTDGAILASVSGRNQVHGVIILN
jgi:hypothetical protein